MLKIVIIMELCGKAGATFDATTLEDFASVFGIIALHKTMLGFALAFVWLICSFRHNYLSYSLLFANICFIIH